MEILHAIVHMDAILDILLLLADDIGLNKNDLLDVWPLLGGVGGVIVPRQIFTWMPKKEGLVAGSRCEQQCLGRLKATSFLSAAAYDVCIYWAHVG